MNQPESSKLARAYLRILAQDELKRTARGGQDVDLDVEDEADPEVPTAARKEADGSSGHVAVPADLAAVAVLVARAIHAEPDLLRRLHRDVPVVVLATHVAELVGLARTVLEKCVFKAGTKVCELTSGRAVALRRNQAVLVFRDGSARDHRPDVGNELVRSALHARIAIVGIAPEPGRQLPRDLMRAAEHSLVLPALDRETLTLVVEAATGGSTTRQMDEAVLRAVEIADLPIAVRTASTPDGCMDAITRVVAAKSAHFANGPILEDLYGYGAAKNWGLALAADLQAYRAGTLSWADIDNRGLLLSGPPGVGKTSFVRALAQSARVPLVATSVAEWNSSDHLGGTLRAIREVFASARAKAPAILFIDEIDGISDRSKIHGEYVQYWTQIVNLVLELLAGVEDRPGVVVIAATNFPDRVDPALRRSGRLDREIAIERPDAPTLARIFRHHLGADTLPEVSLMPLALAARGGTGADVETVVRRARGTARRSGRPLAFDDLLSEIRQGRSPLTREARRRTAVHEAGHAVVCKALGLGAIVDLSLHDGGGVLMVDHAMTGDVTLLQVESVLATVLAGRVAEEIELEAGSIGVGLGPSSDLALATAIARDVELRFGLGILGPVHVERSAGDMFLVDGLLASVTARLRAASERARTILIENRSALRLIAAGLDEAGFLSDADVEEKMRVDKSLM